MAYELIKVSELPELTTPSDPNVLPIQDGDYLKRISFEHLKDAAVGDIEGSLAAAYDSTATYAVGDYCIYEGQLYRCTTAITTAEAWTAGHWTAAVLTDDIASGLSTEASTRSANDNALAADIAEALGDLAAAYSTSATYAVGDYCIYQGQLYRCTTAITTAEAWTSGHWSEVQLGDDTSTLRSALSALISVDVTDLGLIIGGMTTNGDYQNQKYRVVTENKVTFPDDIIINLASVDYRFYMIIYNADGTINKRIGWVNSVCPIWIPKQTTFKFMVARVTENTSETNNLVEFSSITIVNRYDDYIIEAKNRAVYSGDYTVLLRLTSYAAIGYTSIGAVLDVSGLSIPDRDHCTVIIDGILPNEKFIINVTDGNTARPWAFLDKDNKLLAKASGATASNEEIIAPSNAKYLVIQVGVQHYSSAKVTRALCLNNAIEDNGIVTENNESALTEKIIETRYCGNNGQTNLTLLHFSDIHGSVDNIQRILDLKTAYDSYIDEIVHSGDSVATYYGDTNPFATVGGNDVLNLIGNHDCWIEGDTWPSPYNATAQQTYEKFISPFISNWGVTSAGSNLCYYYKDYADYNIRLICLDCMHYDSAQESWLSGLLDGAKANDYSVIIVNHYPPQSGITPINCTFASYGKSIAPVATPPVGTQIERLAESAYTLVDTFITGGGKFICWLAGHTHFDYIGTVTDHSNQLAIDINCGVVDPRYGTDKRVIKTKTQDCMNVIGFDTANHIIKICRVGVSMDWFGRTKNLLSIDYSNKTVIANS